MKRLAVWLGSALVGLALVGCGGEGEPLDRSCRGKAVPNCLPFEFSIVEEATLEPEGLEIGNFDAVARLRIRLLGCGEDTPMPHQVDISAIAQSTDPFSDAGTSESRFSLITVRDNGETFGDAVARDGLIDVEIPNPFAGPSVPANTDLLLRFVPSTGSRCSGAICTSCTGVPFELMYRTGDRFEGTRPPPTGP